MCENCAGEDEDLAPVWRLPAGGSDEPELWCTDCRDRFAHEPLTEADESEEG